MSQATSPGFAESEPPSKRSDRRIEFPYLDGLRGVAALVVVVYHAYLFTGFTNQSKEELPAIGAVVGWGYLGVPIFIVISGYVLMLPTITGGTYRFRSGFYSFIKRRARRILPPYYAALAISLLLIAAIPLMRVPSGTQWDTKLPVTFANVLSHLFLLHDLSSMWIGKINGPLWSVAIEWHIYFLMPLLLILLRRGLRLPVLFALLTVVTMIPSVLGEGTFLHPWFIALFAAGMWAAQITMSGESARWLFPILLAAPALIVLSVIVTHAAGLNNDGVIELCVGVATAALLAYLGRRTMSDRPVRATKALSSRPALFMGLISYSVYLLHSPLLGLANLLLLPLDLPLVAHWAIMTFAAAPLAVFVCWLFFLAVERHFLNTRQKHAVSTIDGAGAHAGIRADLSIDKS